jgi:hypothetical protein
MADGLCENCKKNGIVRARARAGIKGANAKTEENVFLKFMERYVWELWILLV